MRGFTCAAVLIAIASSVGQPSTIPSIGVVRSTLDRELPPLMKASRAAGLARVPGLAIAVIDQGRVVWNAGYGVARAKEGSAVTGATRFQAASLSKPVTAYVALQMVDAGVLDLDSPLTKYVAYADLPDDARARTITARHVLSHTTGFANWRRKDPLNLFFTPGERFSYSGEGYVYLQRALEQISGESLEALAKRLVFQPLGMTRSSFLGEGGSGDAIGHTDIGTPLPPMPAPSPRVNAAASLVTTAEDYARFVAAVLQGDRLSAKTAQLIFTPQVQLDPTCTMCTGREPAKRTAELAWGLGWGIEESSVGRTIWHWGDNPGFKNYVAVLLPAKRGFVFFTNSDSGLGLRDVVTAAVIGGNHPAAKLLKYEQF